MPAVREEPPSFPDLYLPEEDDPLEPASRRRSSAPPPRPSSTPPPAPAHPLARRAPSSRPPRDPRREGAQPIRAERAVATIDARGTAIPEPLPPDRQQRVVSLVTELARSGPESDGPVRSRLLEVGPEALPVLARAFPGNLWIDLARPHRPIRTARHLSGCAAAMSAFGEAAVPQVARLLRAPRPEVRLAACVVAGDLAHGDLVEPLAARLQDELAVVRNQAMLALRACALLPEARALRSELLSTAQNAAKKKDWRRKAIWTLGQLRDAEATGYLVELFGDPDVAETTRQALVLLTGQDHGRFHFRWRSWWKKHGPEGRGRWLVAALDQKDPKLRARAAEELVLLTGEGFDRRNATTTREQAVELGELYARWLDRNEPG